MTNTIFCQKCQSAHVKKMGKTHDGNQKYQCKDCGKNFRDQYQIGNHYIPENISCPSCKSHELWRAGQKNGIKEYICKQCTKRFGENYHEIQQRLTARKNSLIPCPKCNSCEVQKKGVFHDSIQKFYCQNCGNHYREAYQPQGRQQKPITENIYCPQCQSRNLERRGIENGIQKFFCRDCKIYFREKYQIGLPIPDGVCCPTCLSRDLRRTGKDKNIQNYQCKSCNVFFKEQYELKGNLLNKQPIKALSFEDDIWDLRQAGYYKDQIDNNEFSHLDFTIIEQIWLRRLLKKYIKMELNTGTAISTTVKTLTIFKKLSEYLKIHMDDTSYQCLQREVLLDFVFWATKGTSSSNVSNYLQHLRGFLEQAIALQWIKVPLHLIRNEDYPAYKNGEPHEIPGIVLEKINANLDKLKKPIARMWMLGLFAGMRISEIRLCPFDCIKQDSHGNWFITFWRKKNKALHSLPISRDLALIIQEQQDHIKSNYSNCFSFLFCNPQGKICSSSYLSIAINKLIKEEDIRDDNGKLWHFHNHQLRDTRATHLFETGHELVVVGKWLGHKNLKVTQKYVHVSDDTLRRETEKVQKMLTNIRGEAIDLKDLPDTLQEKPSLHVLAIPDDDHVNTPIYGYCGLPLDQQCPHWKACYTCPSFIAQKELLPSYVSIRNKLQEKNIKAQKRGETIKADLFQQQADSLNTIINSLEN